MSADDSRRLGSQSKGGEIVLSLAQIKEVGSYWAIDHNKKHHFCEIVMTDAGPVPRGLDPRLKIKGYIKREPTLDNIQYQPRKKLF